MTIKGYRFRRNGVRIEIVPVAKHLLKGWYIKATEKSLIMSGSTGEVVLRTCLLVLSRVMRIG